MDVFVPSLTEVAMLAYLLLFLGLVALILSGCGEEKRAGADSASPAPALWLIEKCGHKGWLFGTVHMLPQGLVWETPAITKAIERADMLVLEAAGLENETRNAAIFEKLGRTTGLPDIDRKSTRLNSSH